MQNFLVKEDVNFEQMCEEFIAKTFGINKNVTYDVSHYHENLGTPNYTEYIFVEVVFGDYKYVNGLGNEMSESVAIEFENKMLQPFYIDGKFKVMEVYETTAWYFPQKHDEIYGINKDDLKKMFYDFMTVC